MANRRKDKLMKQINKNSNKNSGALKTKKPTSFTNSVQSADDSSKKKTIIIVVAALVLFIAIVAIVIGVNSKGSNSKKKDSTQKKVTTTQDPLKQELTESKNQAVNTLITNYLKNMQSCNMNGMKALDLNQDLYQSDVSFKNSAKVIEGYNNPKIYLKNGPYDKGFVAYTVVDIKFRGFNQTCQGMFQYIVVPQSDGSFKINTSDDLEVDIQNKLAVIKQSEDVLKLIDQVNKKCQEDLNKDAKLKAFAQQTLKIQ